MGNFLDNNRCSSKETDIFVCQSLKAFKSGLSPVSGYEPQYNPELWNQQRICKSTNCYAYALNLYEGFTPFYMLQPGGISGKNKNPYCKDQLIELLLKDINFAKMKLIPISFEEKAPDGMYKIALISKHIKINSLVYFTYHFFRQNPDGFWSHKNASGNIKSTDESNQEILDPQTADIFSYDFDGYFAVTNTGINDLRELKKLSA